VDTVSPVVSITSPSNGTSLSSGTVNVAFTAIDSNKDDTWYTVDGGAPIAVPLTTPWALDEDVDGKNHEGVGWTRGGQAGPTALIKSFNMGGGASQCMQLYDTTSGGGMYVLGLFDTSSANMPGTSYQYILKCDVYIATGYGLYIMFGQQAGWCPLPGDMDNIVMVFNPDGKLVSKAGTTEVDTGLTWTASTKYTMWLQVISSNTHRISLDGGSTWSNTMINSVAWSATAKQCTFYTGWGATQKAYVDNVDVSWTSSPIAETFEVTSDVFSISLADGAHTITIYCNDTLDHISSDSVSFTIDATKPSIAVSGFAGLNIEQGDV